MAHAPLGQVCITLGLLTEAQVEEVSRRVAEAGGDGRVRFGAVAVELGFLDDNGLARALAQQFRLNMVPEERLEKLTVAPEVLALLPPRLMRERLLVPTFLEAERRVLSLLCVDPTDVAGLRLAQTAAQASRLRLFVAPRGAMEALIRRVVPSDEISDVRLRASAEPVEDEPTHDWRDIVFEPDPDRSAALKRLGQLEGDASILVSNVDFVQTHLAPRGSARVSYRRAVQDQVDTHVSGWRKVCADVTLRPVDGWGASAQGGADAREFWLGVTEFLLLAGETRQMEARGRLRRTYRLARALAAEVGLGGDAADAVAVAALFVDVDELSLSAGLLDAKDEGRRFAVAQTLLRQFSPPWELDGLLRSVEARLVGQASPGEHLGAEVLYTARAAVRTGAVDATDPIAALGQDAARHDASVLRALTTVCRRQSLRTRVASGGAANAVVIVAEREVAVVTALEARLSQAGFAVVAVADGEQAMELTRRNPPAAIIANQRLPKKDGLSLLVELRRDPKLRDIPVILLTDTGTSGDVTRGLELGAEDVIAKPVQAQVVLARLRRALSRRAGPVASIVGQIADLPLPELLQTLTLGGRTARIEISGAGETGSVQVRDGRLVAASMGKRTGDVAFYALMALANGRFEVRFEDAGQTNLAGKSDFLILEALRRRDEARARS